MPAPFPYGVTVVRLRGQRVDDGYGGTIIDWSNPDALSIAGCGVAPRTEDEVRNNGRQGVIVGFTVYAPPGVDVQFDDRVVLPGVDDPLEVDGEVGHWRNPFTGWTPGTVINLQRIDG